MRTRGAIRTSAAAALACAVYFSPALCASGQTSVPTAADVIDARATNIIVPQIAGGRAINWRPPMPGMQQVEIASVAASLDLSGGVGTTTLRLTLRNPGSVQQEAQLLVPVPVGATIRTFGFDGGGMEPTAKILPRDEARRIYEAIVSKARDPALLEFVGCALVKSSVFPIAAGGTQSISLTYEQVLPRDGDRIDLALPRTGSLQGGGPSWTITGRVRSNTPITTLYSPSHELRTTRTSESEMSFEVPQNSASEPGTFRLSCLLDSSGKNGLATSVLTYPDVQNPSGGGYFLLLAGASPVKPIDGARVEPQKREVVMVIDRSGSMRGEKIEQARAAATQVITGLLEGEALNIIDYSDRVERFSARPVIKDAKTTQDALKYIRDLTADGGTNLHDALIEALRPEVTQGMLPMVLFLTDGLPTVGITGEVQIRTDAANANTSKRRVFTFGVGFDVNAPLLDHIADASRGSSINVLPKEDVELSVSKVFRRLQGPVMNEPALSARSGVGDDGPDSTRVLRNVMPPVLPDLFEGDQLVVLGRYSGNDKVRLTIEGSYRGSKRSFVADLDPSTASTRNGFVPRLWASCRIGSLVDQFRQAAGGSPGNPAPPKELVSEIVELSTRWGILTEYTSFLATETGAAPVPMTAAPAAAGRVLAERAAGSPRSGLASINQSMNAKEAKDQLCANLSNRYFDSNMQVRTITSVQQTADQTLFFRNNCWVDARILAQKDADTAKPDRTIAFGSSEHFALAQRLADDGDAGRAALLAMQGDIMLLIDGQRVLVSAAQNGVTDKP